MARLLWFPAGAASVGITMYLAHLWLENGGAVLMDMPDPMSAEDSENISDEMASPEGAQEDGVVDEEQQEEQEGENEEAEETEEEDSSSEEKPAPLPPEPQSEAKTPQEPQPQAKRSVDIPDGETNLYEFIKHELEEINSKHES